MKSYLTLFITTLLPFFAFGQQSRSYTSQIFNKQCLYIVENKGQMKDENGCVREDIQFKITASPGLDIFVGKGQLHYAFGHVDKRNTIISPNKPANSATDNYRMDVILEGANTTAQVITDSADTYFERYVTGRSTIIAPTHRKVIYKNIYSGIDWVLYLKDNHLEYDFVVYPEGNVNDIKIRYDGASFVEMNNGIIKVIMPYGIITEKNLVSYCQYDKSIIRSSFVLNDKTVGFNVGQHQGTVVIDPTLEWATYYGAGATGAASGAVDPQGNLYIAGSTYGSTGLATTGAYQGASGGNSDVFLAKFTNAGIRLWSTYFGGSDYDGNSAIACDKSGNVYMAGATTNADSIASTGAFQVAYGGQTDGFLAKFDSTGALLWSTYYGGAQHDVISGLVTDDTGNAYIVGSTYSTNGIASPAAYQTTLGGGLTSSTGEDAFLAKFGPSGDRKWGTYFGHGYEENGNKIAIDKAGNLFIAGVTDDFSASLATSGTHQVAYGGGDWDAFLAKFNQDGILLWNTYYGGDSIEEVYGLACDTIGNAYMTGATNSLNNIATTGSSQQINYGYLDSYLAKFDSYGGLLWGTYFGGEYSDLSFGVNCGSDNRICITGMTSSPHHIATAGAYQTSLGGGVSDAFLAIYDDAGALLWSSYYGGEFEDDGAAVVADAAGSIFLLGETASYTQIATIGSFQPINNSGAGNAFIAKFDSATTHYTHAGIKEETNNLLCLFPNPAENTLHIQYGFPEAGTFQVFDICGRCVGVQELHPNNINATIDISNLLAGTYIYKVFCKEKMIARGNLIKK